MDQEKLNEYLELRFSESSAEAIELKILVSAIIANWEEYRTAGEAKVRRGRRVGYKTFINPNTGKLGFSDCLYLEIFDDTKQVWRVYSDGRREEWTGLGSDHTYEAVLENLKVGFWKEWEKSDYD